jgi:hypothetical protein
MTGQRDTLRSQMIGRLVAGAFFIAYLIAQAPHLVHHFFEPDEIQADCVFLAAAERHQAAPTDDPSPPAAAADGPALPPAPDSSAIPNAPGAAGARAPPSFV